MSRVHWSLPVAAAVVAVLVYLNALGGEFIYDDRSYIQNNPSVLGTEGIFDQSAPPHREVLGLYRPLTILTYHWTYRVRGLDPFIFHLANVLLHGAVAALVVLLAARLGAGPPAALLAGLVFAVHPVHVEAVAWVVGRAEILAALLGLAALLAYGRPTDRHALPRSVAAALLYGLAGLSKETVLPLPAFFLLLDLLRRGETPLAKLALRIVPAALVCALIVFLRWQVLGRFGPDTTFDPFLSTLTPGDRPGVALVVLGRALGSLLFPRNLSIYYDPASFVAIGPTVMSAIAVTAVAVLAFVLLRRRVLGAVAGLLLFLVAMIPFLHLVPIGAIFADRFLYLPSAGFAIAFAVLLLSGRRGRAWRAALAGALLVCYAGLTVTRNVAFRDTISLWVDATRADPQAAFPLYQLGGVYEEAGITDYQSETRKGAVYYWLESLRVDPNHAWAAETHLKLAIYYAGTVGDAARAARHYQAALEKAPDMIEALLGLAALRPSGLVSAGQARQLLLRVLALKPGEEHRLAAESMLREIGP